VIDQADTEEHAVDRPDSQRDMGPLIGRRGMITMMVAAGVLTPLVGTGTAQAASSTDSWYDIPEESGSVPWW
jgi:hypothetical protein